MFILLHPLRGLLFFTVLSRVAVWRFSVSVQTGPGAHPASSTMVTGSLSRGVNRPGRDFDHTPAFSAEVNEKSSPIHLVVLWAFIVCFRLNFSSNLDSSHGFILDSLSLVDLQLDAQNS